MENNIDLLFDDLSSKDDKIRLNALKILENITTQKVNWFDKKYEMLIEKLKNENSYQRSIGIILLSNLSKSDSKNILKNILPDILKHTQDEKFITSRQCIQNIWKFAISHDENKNKIIEHLKKLFLESEGTKHYNLLRIDILNSLNQIYKSYKSEIIKKEIDELIISEKNDKYKKEYMKIIN